VIARPRSREAVGCPPPGQRPGEGTSIGELGISRGEMIDSPRYAGAGTPKPDFDVDIEYAPLWAGESVDVVNDILPAGEIVRRLAREAERALAERYPPIRLEPLFQRGDRRATNKERVASAQVGQTNDVRDGFVVEVDKKRRMPWPMWSKQQ
jgi:hypothetical protein